ncbi:glycosyltransferase family 4 protein [Pontibacillus marinus]|uniref:Glycosyl transferase family 1 n=1 Tax=Pontibacillus marinus BH030004 = DSM 16465 TaxID=1385511 RepID=A0A0A5GIQ9_9BACI|nr:glycosyltransferase family 1 protein [Pontibacillus marinus]KGX91000.1 glycosyl transferase family 1 [Pontibacillus marinus BH030004 = DSM 16465]
MKIVYDPKVFSFQQYGGISRYFYEIITRIAKYEELEVSPFMGFHKNKYGLENYKDNFKDIVSFKLPNIPKSSKLFMKVNELMFTNYIKKNKFDIYHQTFYSKLPNKCKSARIVTVHDMIHEKFPQYFSLNDPTSYLKKKSVENSDGIICVSESTKKDLINIYNVPEPKIRVIHHGNSLRTAVNDERIIDAPYIFYVGDRKGYKNFHLLLDAYSNNMWVKENFHIVCFGGGQFKKEELDLIDHYSASGKVHHLSGSDQVLANLYNYASLFVYPSLYEGFGIPPLEAMYYGCPVLVSNTSSIPEIVGDAGIYFDPYETEDFIEKLTLSLENTQLREDIILKGYKQEKKYSWDRCSKETFEFYRQFLS